MANDQDAPTLRPPSNPRRLSIGFGLRFPAEAWNEQIRLRILTRPAVRPVWHAASKRWMVTGEDSGGSRERIGHYIGFVPANSHAFVFAQPIQSIMRNTIHRRVIATGLVRAQIFRTQQTCEILATHHWIDEEDATRVGVRPKIQYSVLFHGRNGIIDLDIQASFFFGRDGSLIEVPPFLDQLVATATRGVTCDGCNHVHMLAAAPIQVPAHYRKQTQHREAIAVARAAREPAANEPESFDIPSTVESEAAIQGIPMGAAVDVVTKVAIDAHKKVTLTSTQIPSRPHQPVRPEEHKRRRRGRDVRPDTGQGSLAIEPELLRGLPTIEEATA